VAVAATLSLERLGFISQVTAKCAQTKGKWGKRWQYFITTFLSHSYLISVPNQNNQKIAVEHHIVLYLIHASVSYNWTQLN
jgi:hypothetical protein